MGGPAPPPAAAAGGGGYRLLLEPLLLFLLEYLCVAVFLVCDTLRAPRPGRIYHILRPLSLCVLGARRRNITFEHVTCTHALAYYTPPIVRPLSPCSWCAVPLAAAHSNTCINNMMCIHASLQLPSRYSD